MDMEVDKVDMSLDDIIKLNKKEQRASRGGGRGARRGSNRGRGSASGVRGGRGRGGRGNQNQPIRTQEYVRGGGSMNRRGQGRGQGANRRGRGRNNTRGVGRNRYNQNQQSNATATYNPLDRVNLSPNVQSRRGRGQSTARGTRARGAGGRGQGLRSLGVRSLRGQLRGQQRGQGGRQQQGFTSLNRQRQQAINSLLRAKQTLQHINARQKQSRSLLVNQRRGLQASTTSLNSLSPSPGRGRGRGRGNRRGSLRGGSNLGRMSQFGSTLSVVSLGSTASTLSKRSLVNQRLTNQRRGRGRGRGAGLNRSVSGSQVSINSIGTNQAPRRRWRQSKAASSPADVLTVSVENSPAQRRNKLPRYNQGDSDSALQAQIKSLKPAVSVVYNFKKSAFAQATSTSLSERFTSTSPNAGTADGSQSAALGRKVFF